MESGWMFPFQEILVLQIFLQSVVLSDMFHSYPMWLAATLILPPLTLHHDRDKRVELLQNYAREVRLYHQ